jgi:hypothetical protein
MAATIGNPNPYFNTRNARERADETSSIPDKILYARTAPATMMLIVHNIANANNDGTIESKLIPARHVFLNHSKA